MKFIKFCTTLTLSIGAVFAGYAQQKEIIFNSANPATVGNYVARDLIEVNPTTEYNATGTDILNLSIDKGMVLDTDYDPNPNTDTDLDLPTNTSLPVGKIDGAGGVSATGAATYNIPIKVAPGTAGMQPSLAITYNSMAGNGMLGYGWNLSGLSAITRAPQTIYHNGKVRQISLDGADNFMLDGNRIVRSGPGSDVFYLESETYSRVTWMAGGWFQVETKDGKVLEYGQSLDSKHVSENGVIPLSWHLNKVSDSYGNYMTLHYTADGNGFRPVRIDYTGNTSAGITPYNSIHFYYDVRDDGQDSWTSEYRFTNNLILREIQVKNEDRNVKSYEFKYAKGSLNLYSFLKEVIEKGSDGKQLNATKLKYDGNPNFNMSYISHASLPVGGEHDVIPGDYNGDGKTDLLLAYRREASGAIRYHSRWELYLNINGQFQGVSGGVFPSGCSVSLFKDRFRSINNADFTGDGQDDLIVIQRPSLDIFGNRFEVQKILFYRFHNNNFYPTTKVPTDGFIYGSNSRNNNFTGDFDGDGLIDFLTIFENGTPLGDLRGQIYYPARDEVKLVEDVGSFLSNVYHGAQVHVVDNQGDGKMELMVVNGSSSDTYDFSVGGTTVVPSKITTSSIPKASDRISLGDFNGDGKMDLLTEGASGWTLIYSKGTTRISKPVSFSHAGSGDYRVGDFNGDGKSDVLFLVTRGSTTEGYYVIYYSNGRDFEKFEKMATFSAGDSGLENSIPGFDFNGDGSADIFKTQVGRYPSIFSVSTNNKKTRLLHKVKNGFNQRILYHYEYLTNDAFYTKASSSNIFPVLNIKAALPVVSSVEKTNGIGGFNETSYQYEGAQLHVQGAGFLGFTKRIISTSAPDRKIIEEYELKRNVDSEILYRAQLKKKIVNTGIASGSQPISQDDYTYDNRYLGDKRFVSFPYTSSHVDFVTTKKINKRFTYDTNGNLKNLTEEIPSINGSDPLSLKTTNNIYIKLEAWLPSKLKESIIEVTDGQEVYTEKRDYNYWPKGALLNSIVTFNNNSTKRIITTSFINNSIGLTTRQTRANEGKLYEKTYGYDDKWRFITSEVNTEGHTTTKLYDNRWGLPISVTSPSGLVTRNYYDSFGRLVKTEYPNGNVTSYTSNWETPDNPDGQDDATTVTNATYSVSVNTSGNPDTKTWFDKFGRERKKMVKDLTGAAVYTVTSYNNTGAVATSTSPFKSTAEAVVSSSVYSPGFNQLESISNEIGTISYLYEKVDELYKVTVTAADDTKTYKKYDAGGRLVEAWEHDETGGRLKYFYNAVGQVKEVQLGTGWISKMTYDWYGNQKTLADRNTGTTTYTYNGFGELLDQTDGNGKMYTNVYDDLGRLETKTGEEGIYTYEYVESGYGLGLVKKITAPNNTAQVFDYDGYNRLRLFKEEINGENLITQYTYDAYGRQEKMIYPSGFTSKNTYSNGHLSNVSGIVNGSETLLWSGQGMDAHGNYTQWMAGNGVLSKHTYNKYGYPTRFEASGVSDLFFTIDPKNGNLVNRWGESSNVSEGFEYDALNRLTHEQIIEPPITSGGNNVVTTKVTDYASNGNIISKTYEGNPQSYVGDYSYDPDKIHAVSQVDNYTSGISNLTQIVSYTPFNKVSRINENTKYIDFTYGPDHERKKVEWLQGKTPIKTRFYTSNYDKELDFVSNETREIHYIGGGSGLVAMYVIENGAGAYYYPYRDHLGSILTVTDANANIVAKQSFDPWGRKRNPANIKSFDAPPVPKWLIRGYTGHEHLEENGLINMNGRMYDPILGRMLSPDNYVQNPNFTQNYNRYSYVFNNPLKYTDPTGQITWYDVGAGLMIVGGVALVATGAGAPFGFPLIGSGIAHFGKTLQMSHNQGIPWDQASNYAGLDLSISATPNWGNNGKRELSDFDKSFLIENSGSSNPYDGGDLLASNNDYLGSNNIFENQGQSSLHSTKGGGKNVPGGNWDFMGEGSVPYTGDAWFGTNFIGPGPDVNPFTLKLRPVDAIDQGARMHDYYYWKEGAGGVPGAVFNTNVQYADLYLIGTAYHIMKSYKQGGMDNITGLPISVRTYNIACAVYCSFLPLAITKMRP